MSRSRESQPNHDMDITDSLPSYEDAQRDRPYIPPTTHRTTRITIPVRRASAVPPRYPSEESYDPEAQVQAVQAAAMSNDNQLIADDNDQPRGAAQAPQDHRRPILLHLFRKEDEDHDFGIDNRRATRRDICGCLCCVFAVIVIAAVLVVVITAILQA